MCYILVINTIQGIKAQKTKGILNEFGVYDRSQIMTILEYLHAVYRAIIVCLLRL
jgi:hypothetical protein